MISEEVKAWIIAMFRELGLGTPVFATAEPPKEDAETEGEGDKLPDISAARAALAERLDKIAVPERLPNEEAQPFVAQINSVRSVLDNIKTPEGLAKAEAGVTKLSEIADGLQGKMDTRLARETQLLSALTKLKQPDMTYLEADELPDMEKATNGIRSDLSGELGDTKIKLAEDAIRGLATKLAEAKPLSEDRQNRSTAVTEAFQKLERPVGGIDEDYQAYDKDIAPIEALKGTHLGEKTVAAAEAAMARLESEAARLVALFQARALRAKRLQETLGNLKLYGIDAASGLTELTSQQESLSTSIAEAKGDTALDTAESAITEFGEKIKAAQETRAATLKSAASQLSVSDELPQEEAKPLRDQLDTITSALNPPLEGAKLETAAKQLAELPAAIKVAMDVLENRKSRFKSAVDEVGKLTDPDHANATEQGALKLLREAAALILVPPLSEAKTTAATEAARAMAEKHAELSAQITAREDKRAEVLKTLLSLAPPNSATAANVLKILKEISDIRKRVIAADTINKIEAEDTAIAALRKTLKDVQELVAARIKANTALASAEAVVKAEQKTLFAGGYTKLLEMLKAATAQIDAAKKAKDCEDAETEIAKIQPYLTGIKSYRADLDQARIEAEFHIQMMKTKSDLTGNDKKDEEKILAAKKVAMQKLWWTLMASADKLAAQGKVEDAKKELAKFKTQNASFENPVSGNTETTKYAAITDSDAKAFPGIVAQFMKDKYPIIDRASDYSDIVPVKFTKLFGDARSKGFTDEKWSEAATLMSDLGTLLDGCKTFLDAYEPYHQLLISAPSGSDLALALDAIKTDCEAENFAAAKLKVDALDALSGGAEKKNAAFVAKQRSLQARVNAVTSALSGKIVESLSEPWNKAKTETDHGKRMALLDDVAAALGPCMDLVAARDAAIAKLGALDDGSYKILDAAKGEVTAGDLAKATQAYRDALPNAEKLAAYLALKARLDAVKGTYDTATDAEAIKTAQDALDSADQLAKAQKLDDASAALKTVLEDPGVALVDQTLALFQARRTKVQALHDKVVGAMEHAKSKKKITDPWDTIQTKAAAGDYLEAITLLNAHVETLEEARPYVEARLRARKAVAALHSIASKLPTVVKDDIYKDPLNRAKLDGDLAAAEDLAKEGKFAEAIKAFNDLVNVSKDRMKLAAKGLEDKDGGHFLEGHGPDVTREATLARMTTGIRPDGAREPSRKSSQFEDIGDFMMCYDLAWADASKKSFFGGTTLKPNQPSQVGDTIQDVGKSVGMGVEGIGSQKGFSKGVPGQTELYDTYEVSEGISGLQYKFIFHFKSPNDAATKPLTSHGAYAKAYKRKHGVDVPSTHDCPGHWALNQLLPSSG